MVAGTLADADWCSYLGGPEMFLRGRGTATHSIVGAAAIAILVAAVFAKWKGRGRQAPPPFSRALAVAFAASGAHVLLDLGTSDGVKLFWPFRGDWFAADLLATVDPWILAILLAGVLLPALFGLVGEEIGARKKGLQGQVGAAIALGVVALYAGGRALLHEQAIGALEARTYRGETPLNLAAFPEGASPLEWNAVVETESGLHELRVSRLSENSVDPESARTSFKPEASAALEHARASRVAQEFLRVARFPKARVERTSEGFRVELRDLRFRATGGKRDSLMAVVELNPQAQVVREELRFADGAAR